jgi:hypothetical protein
LNSFNLDGSGYAEVADINLTTDDFTLALWVKPSQDDFDATDPKQMLFGCGLGNFMFDLSVTKIRAVSGHFIDQNISYSFIADVWYYVTVTRAKSGLQKIYVNASEIGSIASSTTQASATTVTLGTTSTHSSRESYSIVDEHKIYNRALTQKEITQNYKAGINKHKASSSFSDDFSSDYGI